MQLAKCHFCEKEKCEPHLNSGISGVLSQFHKGLIVLHQLTTAECLRMD